MGNIIGQIDTSEHFLFFYPDFSRMKIIVVDFLLLQVLVEHETSITAVAISEDGKHVLTGDKDGQAILWSFKDGKNETSLDRTENKKKISRNNRAFLGAVVHKLMGHKSTVVTVAFTIDCNTAITGKYLSSSE